MVGKKNCLECGEAFESNSVKQKFHSVACKNKYNHRLTSSKMAWELQQTKKRKKNIKILASLSRKNRKSLTKSNLILLGFDLLVGFVPIQINEKELAFRFGSFYLILLGSDQCKILTLKEYEDYVSKTT